MCLRAQGFNQVLGSRKTWRLLNAQQGHDPVARCTVERRIRALGISGIGPGRKIRTTRPAACAAMPPDLLGRDFTAAGPDQRWAVDFTYVHTWSGFCYTAFVMDLFSRRIVGWSTSTTMSTDFVLGALEHAIWQRKERQRTSIKGVVHHSDHGTQYLSIRYSQRLAQEQIQASTGAVGSSYDNAAAEAPEQVLQTRTDLDPLMARPRRGRSRHRHLGRLVQPHPPPPHQPRRPPTSSRRRPLPSHPQHRHGTRRSVTTNPPQNSGRSIAVVPPRPVPNVQRRLATSRTRSQPHEDEHLERP